jgi:uncharacterized protein
LQHLSGKPVVEYPCPWEYRIIGGSPEDMRAAVAEVLGERSYTLHEANQSSSGRWRSMSLELVVHSEEERNAIHRDLTAHRWIRLAL